MDALLAAITLWLSTNIQPSSNLDYLRTEFNLRHPQKLSRYAISPAHAPAEETNLLVFLAQNRFCGHFRPYPEQFRWQIARR